MTTIHQIYRCMVCGNMVEVVRSGEGTLACCNQPMKVLKENTSDGAREKHVPVIEKIEGGYRVQVGSTIHLMLPEHHIEWIELQTDTQTLRHYLQPNETPEATFLTTATKVVAREFCNLHGLWKGE